ncbi:MAG: hypothetical protein GWQ05_11840 [Verrucomicrobiaceae bacterium]|nr:hypothetical protein [Verrucomicrobiaceae bacterium]
MPQKVHGTIEAPSKIITPATPTAFKTRSIGFIVKAAPQLGPGGEIINIELVSEMITHERDAVSGQREVQITYPLFHTMKVTTNLPARAGEYMLARVYTPPEESHALKEGKSLDDEKRIMVFVRGLFLPSPTPARLRTL